MPYRPRFLSSLLHRAFSTFPVVLVTGARQTGKTTLLRNRFGGTHEYVSLERPDVRARALDDPEGFFRRHAPPVILDEIQQAPDLLGHIKDRVDTDRAPGRWLLTGSQSFGLMKGVGQTLAGRVAVLHLDSLSVAEVVGSSSVEDPIARAFPEPGSNVTPVPRASDPPALTDWLLRGSFPEPRFESRVDRTLWYSSYVSTYLERDVRDLVQVGDLGTFHRFLRHVASRTGGLLNVSDLARDTGVSTTTAARWLSVLETSQLVVLLAPFHRNLGKRLRKSPKLYWLDPGLATFLMGLHDEDAILHGPAMGALAETAVVSEWVKALRQRGDPTDIHHWRSSDGIEVDLVIERGGRLYGIEVKATATPTPHHADSLGRWLALAGPTARGVLACQVPEPLPLRPGIACIPWHLAW